MNEFHCMEIVNCLPSCERYLKWNMDYDKGIKLCYK